MHSKALPAGLAAFACFSSTINANPYGSRNIRNGTGTSLLMSNEGITTRAPHLNVPNILSPVAIEVRPDGFTQAVNVLPPAANGTTITSSSLHARGRKPKALPEPTLFDNRPAKYVSHLLHYTVASNSTSRDADLSQLWTTASDFNKLDGGKYYGSEKWFILQKFNVGVLPKVDDNNEDIDFVARLFGTSTESLKWFSNQMTTAQHLRDDEHWPEYGLYEPIDHYNWIRKAHSTLGRMSKAEQKVVNDLIDNIDKHSPGDLLKLYEAFEVHPDMLPEHKLQAAEFFQIAKLEFPVPGIGNPVKSSRGPVHIHDWNDKEHPRRTAIRPVDALARYAIPATDSNHGDWTTKISIKLAHLKPEKQREWRDRIRMIPKSYAPTPRDLKDFYDMLDVDWQGKDSDAKKVEVAEKLCVRELVFSDMPKKRILSHKWNWSRVPQQPAMVNACTEEQRDERLKELFFIERWDADHKDPLQARGADSLGEKIDEKIEKLKELFKPGKDMVGDKLKEWEEQLDRDLTRYRGNLEELQEKLKPLVKDAGKLGEEAWAKLQDELLLWKL